MLKSMRKNLKSLAPALWFVIAAFIISIFAVWGGAGQLGESRSANTIAEIGGKKIEAQVYVQSLQQRLEMMREQFQELDANFIQQLNIPQQVLEQIIQRNVLLESADRLGIRVGSQEIRDKVVSYPVFQKDGQFVGFAEYQKILSYNRMSPSEFEKGLAQDIAIEKTVDILTAGTAVSRDEVWENYKKNNESAKLEYVLVESGKMADPPAPTTDQLIAFFESHSEDYQIPEKRSADYIFFNTDELAESIVPKEAEIENYYQNNGPQFTDPAATQVSRIFIPFGDQDHALASSKATALLEQINGGEDFSELARTHSQDEKAGGGGDWGEFDWKRLSREEQEAVEGLAAGSVSAVLELEDGVALLKVTGKEPETQKPLIQVRDQIIGILKDQQAREAADEKIAELAKAVRKAESLSPGAQSLGYAVKSTEKLASGEPLGEIDPQGAFSRALFELADGAVSDPIYTLKGVGLAQLKLIEAARAARFEEVEEQVRQDLTEELRKAASLEKASGLRRALERNGFESTAETNEMEYLSAEEHKREQYLSTIGENQDVDRLAFSLPLNEISEPIAYKDGYLVLQVLDRKLVTEEQFEENLKQERNTLLETRRNKIFQSAYMRLREDIGVKANYNLFIKLNQDVMSRFNR